MRNWLYVALLVSSSIAASGQDAVPKVAVGGAAPDFTMTGIDGKSVQLSEVLAEGKHVVLLFDRAHW